MKKIMLIALSATLLFSCKPKTDKGKFTVTGEIKNAPDQKIYLEELYFSETDPQVLDTADLKNGKFTISALAPDEGIYRLRLENGKTGSFIFINDKQDINFSADLSAPDFQNTSFDTYANSILKNFIINISDKQNDLSSADDVADKLRTQNASDSIINVATKNFIEKDDIFKNYIVHFIDTVSDPIVAVFALGYSRTIDPDQLAKPVSNLISRFPKNETIASTASQYAQLVSQYNIPAPEINLPDTSGSRFALSSLRGKYVLVDFWASWCGPCRAENPNVVKAYKEFKNKNFTVLGVSLDSNKQEWVNAIKSDSLTWNHISDLQNWGSSVVNSYAFNSIPYNVLLDPKGRIIAKELRGEFLEFKLAEILR